MNAKYIAAAVFVGSIGVYLFLNQLTNKEDTIKKNNNISIQEKSKKEKKDIKIIYKTTPEKSFVNQDKNSKENQKETKREIPDELQISKEDKESIYQVVGEENIKPMNEKWKKLDDNTYYNIYTKSDNEEETKKEFIPPQIPSIVTIQFKNKTLNVVIPANSKAFIVTKDKNSKEIDSKPIDSTNSKTMILTPPSIGK